MVDIFRDPTTSVPKKSDEQIVRVPMDEQELGGRKSHIPPASTARDMAISHVPNAGSKH